MTIATEPANPVRLTPSQRKTFDKLLAIGMKRPTAPEDLADHLRGLLEDRLAPVLASWTEPRLWVSKSLIGTAIRCQGQTVAYAQAPRVGITRATAIGTVAHKAIQIAHTHPDLHPADYIRSALTAVPHSGPTFGEYWERLDPGSQSDIISEATSRLTAFLDRWPPLADTWVPRFEEGIHADLTKLKLAARPDLMLGRPRADSTQTMLICDFKTGSLRDEHDLEASFYALVATLSYGVPPFRSTVYSLASGEWTEPDVTVERLVATSETIADAITAHVEVLTEQRAAELTPGPHCRWCPVRDTCPVATPDARPASKPAAPPGETPAALDLDDEHDPFAIEESA